MTRSGCFGFAYILSFNVSLHKFLVKKNVHFMKEILAPGDMELKELFHWQLLMPNLIIIQIFSE